MKGIESLVSGSPESKERLLNCIESLVKGGPGKQGEVIQGHRGLGTRQHRKQGEVRTGSAPPRRGPASCGTTSECVAVHRNWARSGSSGTLASPATSFPLALHFPYLTCQLCVPLNSSITRLLLKHLFLISSSQRLLPGP